MDVNKLSIKQIDNLLKDIEIAKEYLIELKKEKK